MKIYNAKIRTMAGRDFERGYVEFHEGKITAVGDMAGITAAEGDFDAAGATLLPGFVDAHSHLGVFGNGVGFESADANEVTDPVTPHLRASDSVNPLDRCFHEAALAGVTTVVSGAGSANAMGGTLLAMKTAGSKFIDELIIKEPIAIKAALGENPKSNYHMRDEAPTTRMATAALIREQLYKTRRYMEEIEEHERTKGTDDETSLPDYDIKCEALLPVLRREIKVHFHAHRADDIFTAVRIAREFSLDYVLVHATEGGLIADELGGLLGADSSSCIVGPVLGDRGKPELVNHSITTAAMLHKAGVSLAICTDHPEVPIQYLPLSAGLAIRGGLSEEEALRAITITAAEIAGISHRVGSIEVGKDADFVLLEGEFYDVRTVPRHVVIGGVFVC